MIRIIDCLTLEHDLPQVILAALVCAIGTMASLTVTQRTGPGPRRFLWLNLLAVCLGSTVWATHFLAMLAYRTNIPMTYLPGLTAGSLLAGILVIGLGLHVVALRPGRAANAVAGGAVIGVGGSLLHAFGLAAVELPGRFVYDMEVVAVALVTSSALGAAGIYVATRSPQLSWRIPGAALLVLMTVTLHFAGMSAITLELDGTIEAGRGMSRGALAIAVLLASLAVLGIAVASVFVERAITRRLAGEAERFKTLANGTREALVIHRQGEIVDANAAARRLLDLESDEGRQRLAAWLLALADHDQLRDAGGDERVELEMPGRDGGWFPVEVSRLGIQLANGEVGELVAAGDLTLRKRAEARIAHLALHDPLTELPNRRLFTELFLKTMSYAERAGDGFAVLSVDLDGFKQVNDVLGHGAGDELLRVVAARLSALLRKADLLARFGGDEFVILQNRGALPREVVGLADRLLATLSEPITVGGTAMQISASIGVAIFPKDGATVEDLLRNADTAMYRAKADGKATCRFFEEEMDAALNQRRRLEARLRTALAESRLDLAFQPLVSSEDGGTVGFEALVRWYDAELGMVPPSDFIPVAESTGLIFAVGEFVLRRACEAAITWGPSLRVAVNLSAVQFRRKGLVDLVRRTLADTGLDGHRLELEVTESLLIDNREEALETLTALKALGVRIAMDDFGTGYSSLSYLQSFPFDTIKIDRMFIAGMDKNEQNASIVRAVTSMGRGLQMRVVAEGVETDSEAQMLRDFDCDEMQGYLIARPMPANQVAQYLSSATLSRELGTTAGVMTPDPSTKAQAKAAALAGAADIEG